MPHVAIILFTPHADGGLMTKLYVDRILSKNDASSWMDQV
jgi:hypothetical protein